MHRGIPGKPPVAGADGSAPPPARPPSPAGRHTPCPSAARHRPPGRPRHTGDWPPVSDSLQRRGRAAAGPQACRSPAHAPKTPDGTHQYCRTSPFPTACSAPPCWERPAPEARNAVHPRYPAAPSRCHCAAFPAARRRIDTAYAPVPSSPAHRRTESPDAAPWRFPHFGAAPPAPCGHRSPCRPQGRCLCPPASPAAWCRWKDSSGNAGHRCAAGSAAFPEGLPSCGCSSGDSDRSWPAHPAESARRIDPGPADPAAECPARSSA